MEYDHLVQSDDASFRRWHLAAAITTWAVPGLGHYLLGQRQRGVILAVAIGLLWMAGLLIGGISGFDRKDHPFWFLGQMLVGPSVVVDNYHQWLRASRPRLPKQDPGAKSPAFEPSFGRTHEQGLLYTALAGLLNLLAIIDVVYREPGDVRDRPIGRPATEPIGGGAAP